MAKPKILGIFRYMSILDNKLRAPGFWLWLGTVNHCVALVIVMFGCVYSGFSCHGDSMKAVLSVYAFTLFTPQLAFEVIVLLAIFLISRSFREFRENWKMLVLFLSTLFVCFLALEELSNDVFKKLPADSIEHLG